MLGAQQAGGLEFFARKRHSPNRHRPLVDDRDLIPVDPVHANVHRARFGQVPKPMLRVLHRAHVERPMFLDDLDGVRAFELGTQNDDRLVLAAEPLGLRPQQFEEDGVLDLGPGAPVPDV